MVWQAGDATLNGAPCSNRTRGHRQEKLSVPRGVGFDAKRGKKARSRSWESGACRDCAAAGKLEELVFRQTDTEGLKEVEIVVREWAVGPLARGELERCGRL